MLSNHNLYYFEKKKDERPKGIVPLENLKVFFDTTELPPATCSFFLAMIEAAGLWDGSIERLSAGRRNSNM